MNKKKSKDNIEKRLCKIEMEESKAAKVQIRKGEQIRLYILSFISRAFAVTLPGVEQSKTPA